MVLPWAEVRGGFMSYRHYGFLTDGVLSLILLLGAMVVMFSRWSRGKGYAALALSLLALVFPLEVAARIPEAARVVEEGSGVYFGVGAGLPLMVIACIISIIGGAMMIKYKPETR